MTSPGTDRLYFRQLLSGRDFAASDPIAQQMRNFAYLIGDRETGDCVVVDPAYAANDLLDALESDGMHLSGVLVSHHHPDHVGGSMMGFDAQGPGRAARARQRAGPRQHPRGRLGLAGHRDRPRAT